MLAGTAMCGACLLFPEFRKLRKIKGEDPRDLESHLHPVEILGPFWALLRNSAPFTFPGTVLA